jgi:hypothetical protein
MPLNRPRPFIFIGWEVLPCKEHVTARNLPKLLILPRLGVPRFDHLGGRGGLDRLEASCPDQLQGTPSQTDCRTRSDRLAQPIVAFANFGCQHMPPIFY